MALVDIDTPIKQVTKKVTVNGIVVRIVELQVRDIDDENKWVIASRKQFSTGKTVPELKASIQQDIQIRTAELAELDQTPLPVGGVEDVADGFIANGQVEI